MLLNNRAEKEVKDAFNKIFNGQYVFDSEKAPQGQNNYSSNFILRDSNDDKFLLKVILLKKIAPTNKNQVKKEINICKEVSSPYLVSLVDCAETKEFAFLVFPFLEGQNLEEYAKIQTITEEQIKNIIISVLRGIADIHRNSNGNIIHQDLKPENIIISRTGEVKLLDFGASRYKQSPFRGNARHNFAYSSREQIRASRPTNLEELRITISDKADVFSAGLIAYRLLEGEHPLKNIPGKLPADAILEMAPIPSISRSDISVGTKKILRQMLEYEPLNRLNAQDAINALEKGYLQSQPLSKSGFFYCGASSMNRFIKFKNKIPDLFDGLVLEATQIPESKNTLADIRTDLKTFIIDPQTYYFQNPSKGGKKFKEIEYYNFINLVQNPNDFLTKIIEKNDEVKDFIKKIFEFQIARGADMLIAPYFYIPEWNDDFWSIDQEISNFAVEVYNELLTNKPLIKGISISKEILQSDNSRSRILEYLQSLYDYSGFFVLLESSHQETITNESWLKSAKEFFTYLLATQKFVIWSRAEIFGLALAISGLNIATGEFQKQKKFDINAPLQQYGRRSKYFYLPAMFARIKYPEGFKGLDNYSKKNELFCPRQCCDGINFNQLAKRDEEDLALHSMLSLRSQFNTYIGRNGKSEFIKDIKKAQEHYEQIRNHPNILVRKTLTNDIKPNSSSFLSSWTNTLGI